MKPSDRIKEIGIEVYTNGHYNETSTKLEKIIAYLDEEWEKKSERFVGDVPCDANYVQVGSQYECSHCKGDKYLDTEKEYGVKCQCNCHKDNA